MIRVTKVLFPVVCGVLLSGSIKAQLITDRPDQTESAYTVGRGNLQAESGVLMGFEGDGLFQTRRILAPTNLFRYGITSSIELRVLNQFETRRSGRQNPIQGLSDMEIGAKIELFKNENGHTRIAFLSHLLTPTGTTGLTGGSFGTINKISISHELNESLDLGYNLGYDYLGENRGNLTYSLTLGIQINEMAGLYVETYGQISNFSEFILSSDAGLTLLANDRLQFDFSFGTGITDRMNYISAGLSWLIVNHRLNSINNRALNSN